jgi:bisanhydrobacterioruberin hydratase
MAGLASTLAGRRYRLWLTAAMIVFYAIGLAGHLLPATRALVAPFAPALLAGFGILVAAPFVASGGVRAAAWLAGTLVAGFFLEAAGVATGVVFGPYRYGGALGPLLLDVPPVIALNWALVTLGCLVMCRRLGLHGIIAGLCAGILAAGFDWVMEPAAVFLGYWRWETAIPPRNYLVWAGFAALAAHCAQALARRVEFVDDGGRLAARCLVVQAVFFAALRVALAAGALS